MAKKTEEDDTKKGLDMTLDDVIESGRKKGGAGKGRKGKKGKSRGSESNVDKPQESTSKAPEGDEQAEKKGVATENGNGDAADRKLDMSLDEMISKEPKKGKGKGKGKTRSKGKGGKAFRKGGGKGWNGSKGKGKFKGGAKGSGWRKGGKSRRYDDWEDDEDDWTDEEEDDWDDSRRKGGKKGGGKGKKGKKSRDWDYDDDYGHDDWDRDYKSGKGGRSGRRGDYEEDMRGGKGGKDRRRSSVYEEDDDYEGGSRRASGDREGRASGRDRAKWDDAPPSRSERFAGEKPPPRAGTSGRDGGRSAGGSWAAPKRGRGDDQDGPPAKRSRGGGRRIKVSNIPRDLDWRDIKEAFEAETGEILRCDMDKDGVAWIDYKYHKDAVKAVETFDLGELNNKTIGVRIIDE